MRSGLLGRKMVTVIDDTKKFTGLNYMWKKGVGDTEKT